MNKTDFWPCLAFVVLCLAISSISGWVTAHNVNDWYATLIQPSYSPPNWVFGPVWTVLYIMIGIAGGLLWVQRKSHPWAFRWYIVQLIINFAWSFVFFGAELIGWALLDICLLWASILITIICAYRANRWAAFLLMPYFMWVSFAVTLNASLFYLN